MNNNIWFEIIAGKITKIPKFYTIFAQKIPNYIIRQWDRGQSFEAEAEAKILASRPLWPRGLDITDL